MIKLNFKKIDEDVDIGINDAGFETFSHSKRNALARELPQNSGDAGIEDLRPVEIDFDIENIKTSEFPDIENFRKILGDCHSDNQKNKRPDAVESIEEATKILDQDYLKLLIVSDKNTTGVLGPFNKGGPFFTLLKSKGVSIKPDPNAAGSFGIGKNAPFAATPLRTVFYSTKFNNEVGKSDFFAMGKTVLTSFKDSGNTHRDSEGYWGDDKGQPIINMSSLPKWLQKHENGLNVIIPGFEIEDSDEWIWDFALILISNFFTAIVNRRICFYINNRKVEISDKNIKELFFDKNIQNAAEKLNLLSELKQKQKFFETLTSIDRHQAFIEINNFGKFRINVLLSDDGAKKVLFTRNGMCISNSLAHFQFKQFQSTKSFYAIVSPAEPHGDASKNLRILETPQHNSFSIDRIKNSERRQHFKRCIDKLHTEIRKEIKKIAEIKYENVSQLDELNKFFLGTDSFGNNSNSQVSPGIDKGRELITGTKTTPKKSFTSHGDTGSGSGSGNGGNGGGGGGGVDNGSGSGLGSGAGSLKEIQIPIERFFVTKKDYSKRIIFLTTPQNGTLNIFAQSIGFDGEEEPLEIINSDVGEVHSGGVKLKVEKGQKTRLELTLGEGYNGPSNVKCTLNTDS